MTKEEYNKQKELITSQYGKGEYDFDHTPLNESAKKQYELLSAFNKSKRDVEKTKKLAESVRIIAEAIPSKWVSIPEEIIRSEWLIAFNDKQKRIIKRWTENIKQTPQQLSDYLNISVLEVKATLSLEAFKLLRSHLALAYKDLLPLEASAALRECLSSPTENVRFNAIKLILLDAGLYKGEGLDQPDRREKVLDAETEAKLRELGNTVLGINGKDKE